MPRSARRQRDGRSDMRARPISGARGFTLVELAVVLAVLGVLALAMTSSFDSVAQARQHNAAQAHAESARLALRAFALRNRRLPCPDTTTWGDVGREAGGGACGPSVNVGWLPYEALGLEIPERGARLRYGVRRGASTDLVAPGRASVDVPDLEGTGGLVAALSRAATITTTSQPHYFTADPAGPSCSGSPVNPALVLVAPATNRDGAGGTFANFDGIHAAFAAGTGLCVAAPGQPTTPLFDDVVVAESPAALLGWLLTASR
ncbi:type II secretion system protein [Luteimonas sp. 100069]|uniref:type II secretion system protein n=1 Tax=Luteimonas sp. 100069 TaxID=2006109 RepID=UPI00131564BE|nr:type II secretion system protein [Luteimonas sp. 100069]